jgi:tRNA (guanine37-N1)-methyltransferase
MIFDILTLFPDMFEVMNHSIIKRAREKGLIDINIYNIRDYTANKHKKVDDYPYGGGVGMVMQAEPIYNAVEAIKSKYGFKPFTILMSPRGKRFNQILCRELSDIKHIMLICGHYEGIDERIMPLVDMEISLGDFVLTGGEIAAMAVVDSVSRMVPGVLSSSESFEDESFYQGLLEHPQYTRPEVFMDMKVPDVLLSGNHENIRQWRRFQSLKLTLHKRPDLLKKAKLSEKDIQMLQRIKTEISSNA